MAYQRIINAYAADHEKATVTDFHHCLKGALLDALDDDDDVQNAWHTLENEEDLDR